MIVKLNKADLRKIVSESVKQILKEGNANHDVYVEFEGVRSALGDDTIISEMYNWMDGDEIEEFIANIKSAYDLDTAEY